MLYIAILVLLLFFSYYYDIRGIKRGRDAWYNTFLIAFILIAGLRWRIGVDTPNYLDEFYYETPTLGQLAFEDLKLTKPLWILLNSFVLTVFGRFYVVQLIHAAFINTLFFRYIKKHSRYTFTCLFFYFLFMYVDQNMEEMKASISVVICLFANDYVLEHKWVKAYVLYIVAALFHASAWIIFLTPLVCSLRLNKGGFLFFVLSFFFGCWLQHSFGDYVSLFDMVDESLTNKVEYYSQKEKFATQGGNINFYIVYIFPLLFYALYCLYTVKRKKINEGLLRLEPFLMLGGVFLILQMNMQIFFRFVHFYSLYFVLFFSEVYVYLSTERRRISRRYVGAVLLFLPFIFLTLYGYKYKYVRYYPYSSIIVRHIDKDREQNFSETRTAPNINQY